MRSAEVRLLSAARRYAKAVRAVKRLSQVGAVPVASYAEKDTALTVALASVHAADEHLRTMAMLYDAAAHTLRRE